MRFDLDDAYKYKNRPFHSATPLFHAPNLLLFLNYFSRTVEDGARINCPLFLLSKDITFVAIPESSSLRMFFDAA